MNKKLLVLVLVLIMLCSAVSAKETEQHFHKTGARYEALKEYQMQAAAGAGQFVAGMIMPGPLGAANIAMASASFARAKAARQKAQKMPTGRIQDRGAYAFYDYVSAYDDYSGMNKYSALFFGEDWLAKRRQMSAEYFCDKALGIFGGKACWQSRICEPYYGDREPPAGQSVLVVQTGVGGYLPAVSVQGEKSLPVSYKKDGQAEYRHVYKITYSIANPLNKALTYHVKLVGDAKTFTSEPMTIQRATEEEVFRVDRLGGNPLIKESGNDYHTVCLTFNPRLQTYDRRYVSEVCSPFTQYEGAATKPYVAVPVEEGEESAGGAAEDGGGGTVSDSLEGA